MASGGRLSLRHHAGRRRRRRRRQQRWSSSCPQFQHLAVGTATSLTVGLAVSIQIAALLKPPLKRAAATIAITKTVPISAQAVASVAVAESFTRPGTAG